MKKGGPIRGDSEPGARTEGGNRGAALRGRDHVRQFFCSRAVSRGEFDRWFALTRGAAGALTPRPSRDERDAEALADITLRTREMAVAMLDRARDTMLAGRAGGR